MKKLCKSLYLDIICRLIDKWKVEFKANKEKWDINPGWPAKFVETSFCIFGIRCTLWTEDLELMKGPEDEVFMESVQKRIEEDLINSGATEFKSFGFLD